MPDYSLTTPPDGMTDPLTGADVGRLFNADPKTVSRWNDRGLITSIRTPGGHRRFPWTQFPPMLKRGTPRVRRESQLRAPADTASATLTIGIQTGLHLHYAPVAADVTVPGETSLILGWTSGGKPVTLTVRSASWLADLAQAALRAETAGVVEADMAAAR